MSDRIKRTFMICLYVALLNAPFAGGAQQAFATDSMPTTSGTTVTPVQIAPIKMNFDEAVLARMSAFVSNMTECEPQAGWEEISDASSMSPKALVRFAVLHNWMHNNAAFVSDGERATLEAQHVVAAIEDFFGLTFDAHTSVSEDGIVLADSKYSLPADTPKSGPQAVVENVYISNNDLLMEGHIVAEHDADGSADVPRREFRALVGHQTRQGHDGWKLISYKATTKTQAPTAPEVSAPAPTLVITSAVENTVVPNEENATTSPEEVLAPATSEEKTASEVNTAPVADVTPAPEVADSSTPQGELATPDKDVAASNEASTPVAPEQAKQQQANTSTETDAVSSEVPAAVATDGATTDTPPAASPEAATDAPSSAAAPQTASETTFPGSPASDSSPATSPDRATDTTAPVTSPDASTTAPATDNPATPQEPVAAVDTPAPAPAPESAPAPAEDNMVPVPAPQSQAQPQGTLVPFTATSDPDFSKILSITVPDGWSHRDAEGILELTPSADDAWLAVEVAKLGAYSPQDALTRFSGGATLASYGRNNKAFVFETGNNEYGHRKHMIFVDEDTHLVCRLTWLAGEQYDSDITTILHGLMLNGMPVVE